MKQTERIQQMEQMLNLATEAIVELSAALVKYAEAQQAISTLDGYYGSKAWKDDFKADEKGLLPADLKRGVLSEDAVWNLLSDNRELIVRMLEIVTKVIKGDS